MAKAAVKKATKRAVAKAPRKSLNLTSIACTRPALKPGEKYVGAIVNPDGSAHHVVLMPGDELQANWDAAVEWAKKKGGDLPDRVEQAMLWKHLKAEFKSDWYWSCEQHASDACFAWCQNFYDGYQDDAGKSSGCIRARAVRRLPI